MSLKKKDNSYNPGLLKKVLDKMRAYVYRSPLYLVTLRKSKSIKQRPLPEILKTGNEKGGRLILAGQFPFAGRLYKSEAEPWSVAQDDLAWQSWIHGFKWLDDLLLVGDAQAVVKARGLLDSWMDLHGVWTPVAWRPDVMAMRLISWMVHGQQLCSSADEAFIERFQANLSKQACHLSRSYLKGLSGFQLLCALRGQLYLALFIEGYDKVKRSSLERLSKEFDSQILADGGHVSRSPSRLLDCLSLALELKDVLDGQKTEVPDSLLRAMDRMAPMIRTLRHGDGGLGLFHGGQADDADRIDGLLERTGNQGQPLSNARHSGFQRMEAGRTVVLMDVGSPPDVMQNRSGHAAPLSLEMSAGEERILVNCGAVIAGDPSWQEALGATAAHNTLCVDDKNCTQLLHGGGIVPRDITVSSERFEENGQILVDACHDAYKEAMGLMHQRSVYLNKTGDDLRVEDKLTGTGGGSYTISLHLHPDVHASLVQDGKAALLKLAGGSGWHLKVQGGQLETKESIYVANPGDMRHTDQIVIKGPLRGEGTQVKWRLSRIGTG